MRQDRIPCRCLGYHTPNHLKNCLSYLSGLWIVDCAYFCELISRGTDEMLDENGTRKSDLLKPDFVGRQFKDCAMHYSDIDAMPIHDRSRQSKGYCAPINCVESDFKSYAETLMGLFDLLCDKTMYLRLAQNEVCFVVGDFPFISKVSTTP